uniref:Uncharacterized protein n=1 Tax=Arundo donax TaxID=35708 RepID=A0A0A9GAJ2_ARUDO
MQSHVVTPTASGRSVLDKYIYLELCFLLLGRFGYWQHRVLLSNILGCAEFCSDVVGVLLLWSYELVNGVLKSSGLVFIV